MHLLFVLISFGLASKVSGQSWSDSDTLGLSHNIYYDYVDMNLSWTIYHDSKEIEFGIIAPFASETAWIGFGLSMNQGMKGADIVIFNSYNNQLYDTHSYSFDKPILDKINNYKLTYFEIDYANEKTKIRFIRDLIACDYEDYNIETKYLRHNILLSYNKNDEKLKTLPDNTQIATNGV